MTNEQLKQQYESVCNEYIKRFCKKQELQFEYWIADDVGGIGCFGDTFFFNFHDIVWDINSKQPKGLIIEWHDGCVENFEQAMNYHSYTKGLRFSDIKG